MNNLKEKLKEFEFLPLGILNRTGVFTAYSETKYDDSKEGFVYLWVAEKNDYESRIVYVGMTYVKLLGKHGRLKGHENGFKNTKTGIKNKEKTSKIPLDYKIAIYSRHSKTKFFFNIEKVSLCASEEKFFINYFRKDGQPLMNGIRKIDDYKFR